METNKKYHREPVFNTDELPEKPGSKEPWGEYSNPTATFDEECAALKNDQDFVVYFLHVYSALIHRVDIKTYDSILEYLTFDWVTVSRYELLSAYFDKFTPFCLGRGVVNHYLTKRTPQKKLEDYKDAFPHLARSDVWGRAVEGWNVRWALYDKYQEQQGHEKGVSFIVFSALCDANHDEILWERIIHPAWRSTRPEKIFPTPEFMRLCELLEQHGLLKNKKYVHIRGKQSWTSANYLIVQTIEKILPAGTAYTALAEYWGVNYNSAKKGANWGSGDGRMAKLIDALISQAKGDAAE